MAEDGNYKAQLSIKFGNGWQHMLNFRADSVAELAEVAGELEVHGLVLLTTVEDLMAKAAVVNAFPQTTTVEDKPPFDGGAPAAPATNSGQRTCAHGVLMKYQEGKTKAGKPYRAYFCQVENDPNMPKCQAVWLN